MSDLEILKSNLKKKAKRYSDFGYILEIEAVECIEKLEQQLSNSISKDELRGLVEEETQRIEPSEYGRYDSAYQIGVKSVLSKLNKLIEGGSND